MMVVTHTIIPAAGLGTRMLPATRVIAKEMLPVYDRPAIQYIVEEAVDAGISDAVFVTAAGKESIADHFDRTNPRIPLHTLNDSLRKAAEQPETLISVAAVRQKYPRGLGHAVLTGAELIAEKPYAVMLPDVIIHTENGPSCMKRMTDLFNKTGHSVIALMRVPDEDRERYGMVAGTEHNDIVEIDSMVEKPGIDGTDSNLAIVGRYVFSAALSRILPHTKPGRNNEIQLTDAMDELHKREPIYGVIIGENEQVFDTGTPAGHAMAGAFMTARRHPDFIAELSRIAESS